MGIRRKFLDQLYVLNNLRQSAHSIPNWPSLPLRLFPHITTCEHFDLLILTDHSGRLTFPHRFQAYLHIISHLSSLSDYQTPLLMYIHKMKILDTINMVLCVYVNIFSSTENYYIINFQG